jgi:transposase
MPPDPLLTRTETQIAEIVAALRRPDLPPRQRERLELVKGVSQGFDLVQLCAWSGRTPRTVRRWLAAYAAGGIAALADAPRAGRPPQADAAYLAALDAAVAAGPRALGQPFDGWTSARLSASLAQTTGVRIVPGWLRVLLHRREFAHGRPKHTVAHLQDAAEVAICIERLRAVGEKGGGESGAVRTPL